jgi:BlaI family transcriptional regulator, penicillinase repressor
MTPPLTRQELRIMNVVWASESASGREVTDALSSEKPVAYTTVVTLMNILVAKGHLVRERDGRQFRYRPKVAQARVLKGLVRDFIDRVFAGSPHSLMAHLIDESRVSAEEVRDLVEKNAAKKGKDRP